ALPLCLPDRGRDPDPRPRPGRLRGPRPRRGRRDGHPVRDLPRGAGREAGSGGGDEIRITAMRNAECGMRSAECGIDGRPAIPHSAFRIPHCMFPAMQLTEAILQALHAAWSHKLRSFFTLLGIIVSVAFLVAVVAVIQGMNAYVRERIGGAIVGVNAFQVRRTPIAVGLIDDEQWKEIQRRPIIAPEDVHYVERALPDAKAIAVQSGWPTPQADVVWRNKTVGDAFVFGVTAPFQLVQDYQFAAGEPLSDVDVRERRPVAALGFDVADRLFDH